MTELFSVCDYAVRLEDHPLVKAGEVHQVVEMFRGGYLGFAKPVGGEWNPKGWRKCDAEGWMPWSGGENPVPGQMVECKGRYDSFWGATASKDLRWIHIGKPSDIIAFRLSRPASEQPVEAIGVEREEIEAAVLKAVFLGFEHGECEKEWEPDHGKEIARAATDRILAAPPSVQPVEGK